MEAETRITPARIAGAASRLRNTFTRASGDAGAIFGRDAEAWEALGRRVDALAEAASLSELEGSFPIPVTRVLLDLANVPLYASKVHELATWMLAMVTSLEAGNRLAASFAVHLGVIVAEADFINAAAHASGALADREAA